MRYRGNRLHRKHVLDHIYADYTAPTLKQHELIGHIYKIGNR